MDKAKATKNKEEFLLEVELDSTYPIILKIDYRHSEWELWRVDGKPIVFSEIKNPNYLKALSELLKKANKIAIKKLRKSSKSDKLQDYPF